MTSGGIRIRPMDPSDVAAVAAIEAEASVEPWSEALFRGEFSVDPATRHWLVADVDGEIVAFGGMMFVADEGHLMNVAVRSDQQRGGLASLLCAALFDEARQRGMVALTLEVRVSNAAARALYGRLGFAPVGARKDYYRNPDGSREDALVLWLHDL